MAKPPRPSREELLAQVAAAQARWDEARPTTMRALSAAYDAKSGRVTMELSSGCAFVFPPQLVEGLQAATPAQLAGVEVTPTATGLLWRDLEVGVHVEALVQGVFGSKRWMAENMGRAGGSATSKAKAAASRKNGRKGGRPRRAGPTSLGSTEGAVRSAAPAAPDFPNGNIC